MFYILFYIFSTSFEATVCAAANPAAQPIQRRRRTAAAATPTAEEFLARSRPPIPSRPGITYPVRAPALTPILINLGNC